jgi:serine/threonine protein kinase
VSKEADDEPLEMGGLILKPGARIGGYVFMREIGSGGMARVLLAKDPAGALVALKVLRKSRFKTTPTSSTSRRTETCTVTRSSRWSTSTDPISTR